MGVTVSVACLNCIEAASKLQIHCVVTQRQHKPIHTNSPSRENESRAIEALNSKKKKDVYCRDRAAVVQGIHPIESV